MRVLEHRTKPNLSRNDHAVNFIRQYFQENEDEIRELLEARLRVVGRRFADELDFYSVQAELLTRLSDSPRLLFDDSFIRKNLDKVISDKGLDQTSHQFLNRTSTVGNMGAKSSSDNASSAEFLLHQSPEAASASPDAREKMRRNKCKRTIALRSSKHEVGIPSYPGITQEARRWASLSRREYLVIISLMNGLSRKEISELLEGEDKDITYSAYRARRKLSLSLSQLRKTARNNKQKSLRKDPAFRHARVYKWLNSTESPDRDSADRAYKLVLELMPKLTDKQHEIVELLCQGYLIPEMIELTKRSKDSIDESLSGAKKRILGLIEALNNPLTPKDINCERWNNLSQRAQEVYHAYVTEAQPLEKVLKDFGFRDNKSFYSRMKDTRKVLGITVEEMNAARERASKKVQE